MGLLFALYQHCNTGLLKTVVLATDHTLPCASPSVRHQALNLNFKITSAPP